MVERAPDFAERRAVIAKVTWRHEGKRLGFEGMLGGARRTVWEETDDAAAKKRLVDLAVDMDAGRA